MRVHVSLPRPATHTCSIGQGFKRIINYFPTNWPLEPSSLCALSPFPLTPHRLKEFHPPSCPPLVFPGGDDWIPLMVMEWLGHISLGLIPALSHPQHHRKPSYFKNMIVKPGVWLDSFLFPRGILICADFPSYGQAMKKKQINKWTLHSIQLEESRSIINTESAIWHMFAECHKQLC